MTLHNYAAYSVVEQTRREMLIKFGVNPDAWYPTAADREEAAKFDVSATLAKAKQQIANNVQIRHN